jgi:hypothetical protein
MNYALDVAGFGGGICTEIDIVEANVKAFSTALHTEAGDGQNGRCNSFGCYSKLGPKGKGSNKEAYGVGNSIIDSSRPYEVQARFDNEGNMWTVLIQDGTTVPVYSPSRAGNPQGSGVPLVASEAVRARMLEQPFVLVVSLWRGQVSWLDGGCTSSCDLSRSSFTISAPEITSAVSSNPPHPPPLLPVIPPPPPVSPEPSPNAPPNCPPSRPSPSAPVPPELGSGCPIVDGASHCILDDQTVHTRCSCQFVFVSHCKDPVDVHIECRV